MITLKDDLNGLHSDTCIKVYDPEHQKLVGVYLNCAKAAHKLGVTPNQVHNRCVSKTRIYSPSYGKEVACRISKKKPEDEELISKCSKSIFL